MATWKPVFDAVLNLYDDVSTLLRDLDYQLDRQGYHCIHQQHYGFEGTAALDHPRGWLPTWLARMYTRTGEQSPRRFLCVGVLLHPEGVEILNPNWPDPQPPVFLGSMVRYREPPLDRWDLRHALLWLKSDAPMDGTIHRVVPPPGVMGAGGSVSTPSNLALIEYADVMGMPLENLRTGEDLRALVIDPLRRLV